MSAPRFDRPTAPTAPTPLPGTALAGMLLATSLAPLGSTMIAVAIPRISHDTGVDTTTLTTWLVSSYLITSIALQSPGGKVADLIGHGRALLFGLALVTAGSAIGLVVMDVRALALARVLTAAGGAATVPATMAIFRNRTVPERRSRIFGLFGACMGLAAALGPLIGGELTEHFGWRAVFAANLPVVAVALGLVLRSRGLVSGTIATERPRFDWPGSALLTFGLTAVIVALRVSGASSVWLGGAGAAALVAFPVWERRATSPVVDFSLMKNRVFLAGGSIIALQNMAMYPLLFQLPVFFDRVRGLGARAMGQSLLALTLAMMICSLAGGRLTEFIGARAQALAGSLFALAGLWWFADIAAVRSPHEILPGMILIGAGVGLTTPPAQAVSMSTVDADRSGMAGGILSTMRYLGGIAGTTALGTLLVDAGNPAAHQPPMLVYAGALTVAIVLAGALPGRPAAHR